MITFSKEVEPFEPRVHRADVNERNATVSATEGWHHRFGLRSSAGSRLQGKL